MQKNILIPENEIVLAIYNSEFQRIKEWINSDKLDVNHSFTDTKFTLLHLFTFLLGTHYQTEHSEKDQELFDLIQLALEKDANPKAELDTPAKDRPIDILQLRVTQNHLDEKNTDNTPLLVSLCNFFSNKKELKETFKINRNNFFETEHGLSLYQELTINFTYVFWAVILVNYS